MNFVKQRGGLPTKFSEVNVEQVKEQSLVEMEDVPPELFFNWVKSSLSQDHHGHRKWRGKNGLKLWGWI